MIMVKFITFILISMMGADTVSAHYIRPVCNSRGCSMCAQIRAHNAAHARGIGHGDYIRPVKTVEDRFGGTPEAAVPVVLRYLDLHPGDVLVDPGCGDARILIAACLQTPGVTAIGYEIQKPVADLAASRVAQAGLKDRIKIYRGDSTRVLRIKGNEKVYLYLWPELMGRLSSELKRARAVVSYQHEPPGLGAVRQDFTIGNDVHHVWLKRTSLYSEGLLK